MSNKFYITTAIAYTSKKPHIGNTYEAVLTDAIARYKRLRGFDVYFLTGTDEHGQKIQQEAEAAGITPQEYVDNVAGQIKSIWDLFNISYNKFIRTTDEEHVKAIEFTVDRANGRVPVIAGTGSNDTEYALKLTDDANRTGVDGILVVTPYYNKATQKGLELMYNKIADHSKSPVILYNL